MELHAPKQQSNRATFTLVGIVAFLLLIIAAIFITQLSSGRNMASMQASNRAAARAVDVGNRLGELIHTSNALQVKSRLLQPEVGSRLQQEFDDSLKLFRDQINGLAQVQEANQGQQQNLFILLERQYQNFRALRNVPLASRKTALQQNVSINDSIYALALAMQSNLEAEFRNSLQQSSRLSLRAERLSRTISVVAMLSVALLGSMLIYWLLRQLSLMRKLARETEKAGHSAKVKQQFLANMSHEIRTPINAVIGFAGLLQKTALKKDQQQYVDLIQSSGDNLLAIVNDVLDVSKLEAGMMRFVATPFNLRELCKRVTSTFGEQIADKDLHFYEEMEPGLPATLVGDADRLWQVLINLVGNAVKFTHSGFVRLKVERKSEDAATIQLLFTVEDSGIGIEPLKQAAVFQRFEQAESDTDRKFGGTGLGLSIVKQIIEQQGGKVWLQSEPGAGTRFFFTISYALNPADAWVQEPIQASAQELINKGRGRILVAEDNKVNQILITAFLRQWGLLFDVVEDGLQVLKSVEKTNYQLLLLDVQMPVLDGYRTARQLRDKGYTLPIIAMTAHALPGEQERCLEAGMTAYLPKPLKEQDVLHSLQQYLPAVNGKENTRPQTSLPAAQNMQRLNLLFNNDPKFIRALLSQFLEQFPAELDQLILQLDTQQTKAALASIHSMRGTIAVLGDDHAMLQQLNQIQGLLLAADWMAVQQAQPALLDAGRQAVEEVEGMQQQMEPSMPPALS